MDIRPGEWNGEAYAEVKVSRRDFASPIRRTPRKLPQAVHRGTQQHPAVGRHSFRRSWHGRGAGGAPLALVYQDRSGADLRSTLSISFVVGIVMSLVGLGLAGKVEWQHVALALELLPGLLVGLWASRWVVKRLDERWLRPAVLTFAAVAGVIIILLGPGG